MDDTDSDSDDILSTCGSSNRGTMPSPTLTDAGAGTYPHIQHTLY